MAIQFTDLSERIRIKKDNINIRTKVFSAKDGDYFVMVCPALDVSGYGKTESDAKESFNINIKLFCEDLMKLPMSQIDKELKKLGFKKELYHNKNYSKIFVDEKGVLQGLDPKTMKSSLMELEEAV